MLPSEHLKKGWCQNASSLDEFGKLVPNRSPKAIRWSPQGSLNLSVSNQHITEEQYRQILSYLKNSIGDIDGWNNNPARTHCEVIQLMRNAEKSINLT